MNHKVHININSKVDLTHKKWVSENTLMIITNGTDLLWSQLHTIIIVPWPWIHLKVLVTLTQTLAHFQSRGTIFPSKIPVFFSPPDTHPPSFVTFYSSPVMETPTEYCPRPFHSNTDIPPLAASHMLSFMMSEIVCGRGWNFDWNFNSGRYGKRMKESDVRYVWCVICIGVSCLVCSLVCWTCVN